MTRFRSEVLALVAGCALMGCGGGAGNPVPDTRQKYEEFDCPPPVGKIFREDCEKSALQYQGASFQGSVGVGGVGASAEYRQTAIREADALVQLLKEQRTSLCNNFNTCKLTVAEYREEQKRLDDSFVALMALKDKMAAMDAQGAALLLDELRRIRTQAQEVKTASAGVQAAASGSSPPAAPPASAPPTASPAPTVTPTDSPVTSGLLPESIPADQSPVPKSTDWDGADSFAAPKAGQLGCEVKLFKEWLRVSCRGANSSGGTPSAVEAHGCGNDVYTFANPRTKVASVVLRVVKGRTCRSVFSWTDNKRETFVVDWSAGPRAQAKFE